MTPPLTARQRVVLGLIEQAAIVGRYCPTNDEIADAMNASSGSYAGLVIGELETLGVIHVTRFHKLREVEIVATRARTRTVEPGAQATPRGLRPARAYGHRSGDGDGDVSLFRGPPPDAQLVDRDPCWRCGARGDAGCRHQPPSGTAPILQPAEPADGRRIDRGQGYAFMTRKRG